MAMTKITVSCFALFVEIETDHDYPDAISDIAHRTRDLFNEAITIAKENGIDIYEPDLEELIDGVNAEDDPD